MIGSRAGRAVTALVAVLVATAGLVVATPPVPASATTACSDPFPASYVTGLARRFPGVRITAAFADTTTGCWYHLNPGLRITTASVMKAQVLGVLLLDAQRAGRSLTAWEQARIDRMIRYSSNPDTTALYQHVGGVAAMEASDAAFGATATTHTATYGLTRSTAADRARVALRLLHTGGPLTDASRDIAWDYMSTVHPMQEWGISAGVPDGWSVAQKNGFYPASGLGWRIGSAGFVRRPDADEGYAGAVMVEGVGSEDLGIRIVEEISRRVAARLTVGAGTSRPWDRRRCTAVRSGESWASVAARLGIAGQGGSVQLVAGGNGAPMSGQLGCNPTAGAETISSRSTINGRYRPVVADLDGNGHDDIVWYAPGAAADRIWWSGPSGTTSRAATIGLDRIPVAGDFDGDGADDVLWYGPGTRPDEIWYGGPSITVVPVTIDMAGVQPLAGDLDGDGRSDLVLYRAGTPSDAIWYGRPERGRFDPVAVGVTGAYQPIVGDFAGDGADDVLWYAPGTGAERLWSGHPGSRIFGRSDPGAVSGRYRPFAADVDGDGADEVIWYGPGSTADRRWDGVGASRVSTALTITGEYQPLPGDTDGDRTDEVVWYGAGGRPEAAW
ncbi:MAG: hypothetical protein KF906_04705 [Actinobacteria bacterium]|nr:hypothetical protein [Actinomycetota bacterium]